jgi:hypothetical protein
MARVASPPNFQESATAARAHTRCCESLLAPKFSRIYGPGLTQHEMTRIGSPAKISKICNRGLTHTLTHPHALPPTLLLHKEPQPHTHTHIPTFTHAALLALMQLSLLLQGASLAHSCRPAPAHSCFHLLYPFGC